MNAQELAGHVLYARNAARRFVSRHYGYGHDEALSDALLGLTLCLRYWKPERGTKFRTLLTLMMNQRMTKGWRQWAKLHQFTASLGELDAMPGPPPDARPDHSDFRVLVRRVKDRRLRRLLLVTYGAPGDAAASRRAAGRRLGISDVYVGMLHRQALDQLRKSFATEGVECPC